MREMLFKAKTEMIVRTYNNGLDDGEWVKGYLRCDCGMWLIYQFEYDRADQVAYEVNPETICQYIGLTDKNGNKIWENDVVKCQDIIGKIRWNETHLAYTILANVEGSMQYYFIGERLSNEMEVISNIFDNPELLEGSE